MKDFWEAVKGHIEAAGLDYVGGHVGRDTRGDMTLKVKARRRRMGLARNDTPEEYLERRTDVVTADYAAPDADGLLAAVSHQARDRSRWTKEE